MQHDGGIYVMISSDNRRYAYGKSQLIEVICQLRFPTILSIDTREPADFQETVRAAFPEMAFTKRSPTRSKQLGR